MNFFLSNNLFLIALTFFIFFTLLILHLLYGCCSITINTRTGPNDINEKEVKNSHQAYLVYQAKQAKQANKYCPENHFFIPDQSLTREEMKFIAQRGGNNL